MNLYRRPSQHIMSHRVILHHMLSYDLFWPLLLKSPISSIPSHCLSSSGILSYVCPAISELSSAEQPRWAHSHAPVTIHVQQPITVKWFSASQPALLPAIFAIDLKSSFYHFQTFSVTLHTGKTHVLLEVDAWHKKSTKLYHSVFKSTSSASGRNMGYQLYI